MVLTPEDKRVKAELYVNQIISVNFVLLSQYSLSHKLREQTGETIAENYTRLLRESS